MTWRTARHWKAEESASLQNTTTAWDVKTHCPHLLLADIDSFSFVGKIWDQNQMKKKKTHCTEDFLNQHSPSTFVTTVRQGMVCHLDAQTHTAPQ